MREFERLLAYQDSRLSQRALRLDAVQTVKDVVTVLGGVTQCDRLVGLKPGHVAQWIKRGRVPDLHRSTLVDAAAERASVAEEAGQTKLARRYRSVTHRALAAISAERKGTNLDATQRPNAFLPAMYGPRVKRPLVAA